MPDLRAIIENRLNVGIPDIYLRDNPSDIGVPHNGPISTSPDVILRPNQVPNPQLAYGEGSGTEASMTLGYEASPGRDNYIYTRVRNRGSIDAGPTSVDVYWSEVAMLLTPDMWNYIGTATVPAVPAGDILTVAEEIVWGQGDIPAAGHYCFVAIASTANDPAPPLAHLTDFDNFNAFIRNNNNATWRNFNVVPSTGPSADPVVMPFLAVGALDRGLRMGLEVVAHPREPSSS